MSVKVATSELLLESLIDNPNIKAVVLVDDRGFILDKRGTAHSIRDDDEEVTMITAKKPSLENVYIVQAGDEFLVVVFDERLNFERLKQNVDNTLRQFDLAVETGVADSDDD